MNGRLESGEDLGFCVYGEGGGVRRERGKRVRGVYILSIPMFSHLLLHLLSNNCWHRHALIWHTKMLNIASIQLDMQLSLNTIQGRVYQELFETRVLEREKGEREEGKGGTEKGRVNWL